MWIPLPKCRKTSRHRTGIFYKYSQLHDNYVLWISSHVIQRAELYHPVMKEFEPLEGAASIVSVTDRVRPVAIGASVTALHFLGERASRG